MSNRIEPGVLRTLEVEREDDQKPRLDSRVVVDLSDSFEPNSSSRSLVLAPRSPVEYTATHAMLYVLHFMTGNLEDRMTKLGMQQVGSVLGTAGATLAGLGAVPTAHAVGKWIMKNAGRLLPVRLPSWGSSRSSIV